MNGQRTIDVGAARIAAAIGEPARARMLYTLLDGHARTGTELAIVGEVSPSTASVHLARLTRERLVKVSSQGKHRYFSLENADVARALEALTVVAGADSVRYLPRTPVYLRGARTCYDHMAGHAAVLLRERFERLEWLRAGESADDAYDVSEKGAAALAGLGFDLDTIRSQRRRFAYACIDWSERRPHIGGALGDALLQSFLRRRWFVRELDSRALRITALGRRQMRARFNLQL